MNGESRHDHAFHYPDTAPHSRTPGTARAALAYPEFRILFIGMALSSIGTWMQNFTLPAYVDGRTGSASLVGLLIFVQLGPVAPPVDPVRRHRRPIRPVNANHLF